MTRFHSLDNGTRRLGTVGKRLMMMQQWWKGSVVYQIQPRTFNDSDSQIASVGSRLVAGSFSLSGVYIAR